MENKQIRSKKIYEEVSDLIIHRIKSGELSPGDRLDSVEKMAHKYGVSRSAVREALSGLRALGIVSMHQGEGTFVTGFDASTFSLPTIAALMMGQEDMKELNIVRSMLEISTVSFAAAYHHSEDVEHLERALYLMTETKGEKKLGEKADIAFHTAIAKATHNNILINLVSSISDMALHSMERTTRFSLYSEEGQFRLYNEHMSIFNAIKNRDTKLAEQEMRRHLSNIEAVFKT